MVSANTTLALPLLKKRSTEELFVSDRRLFSRCNVRPYAA